MRVYSRRSAIIDQSVMPLSNLIHTSFIIQVILAAITAIGKQTFWEDPTALNQNLFPVKAKGLVLFLSVSSCNKSKGRLGKLFFKFPFARTGISSIIELTVSPKNADIIRGGAQCPPNLSSFPQHETDVKYNLEFFSKAFN